MNDLKLGQVVRSTAGRDKGILFLIIQKVDDDFFKVCDGDLRRVDNAKLKNKKHLAKINHVISELKERLEKSQRVSDAEIRRYLEGYRNKILKKNGGI
ncbi:RNA-binding protein [Alkalibaculum sp. M08DMB]|uniref:RNA-binding protein n=1 Tax=Alkalibaculum sporogenes TaxID=2655001 RepID=A0A6A7K6J6_9FIRM|nr:KOW domain-containing RNA-binding protein [Alkalibaculum sporogenes]MPW25004.1 RNA-binding protein [Alkalibaculum sporogenes]